MAVGSALVAVSGNPADEHALRLAAQMTEQQRGSLYILHVIEVERSLPVDSEIPVYTTRGDDLLDTMEQMARPFKCEVYSELLQARRAGHAIVQEAAEREVDVVVIGMPYKTKYGKFALGDVVPYVLEHAPCRVVLWRGEMLDEVSNNGAAVIQPNLREVEHGVD